MQLDYRRIKEKKKVVEMSADKNSGGFTHLQEAKRDMQFATEVALTESEGCLCMLGWCVNLIYPRERKPTASIQTCLKPIS